MYFAHRTEWELRSNQFALALEHHRSAGRELLDLTASNPPDAGLKYDTGAILGAFQDIAMLEYHPQPKGLLSARYAVAEYYAEVAARAKSLTAGNAEAAEAAEEQRVRGRAAVGGRLPECVDAERIVLTTSTSEAYTYTFRLLCDPGDEVLIPTPSYPLFEYLAGLQDVQLKPYALFYDHGWHVDSHSLRQAIGPRTRAIMLVNPNNPTGSYASLRDREELNAICRERELALIVDEVFLDYSLSAARPSFAFNLEALTFTLSGISKICGLPQMKLAWMVISGPDGIAESALARLEIIADTYLSMSAPVQLAAPALLNQRHNIQSQLAARIRANLAELDCQLGRGMVSRLEVEGGWYAVLRVPRVRSDEELAVGLIERMGVLVQPGYFYDFPGEGYIVVSLITPEAEFAEGMRRLLEFVHA